MLILPLLSALCVPPCVALKTLSFVFTPLNLCTRKPAVAPDASERNELQSRCEQHAV